MLGLIEIDPRRCGPSPGRQVKLGSSSSARFTLPDEPRILKRFTPVNELGWEIRFFNELQERALRIEARRDLERFDFLTAFEPRLQ